MKVIYKLEDLAPEYPAPIVTIGNFDGIHLGHQQLMRDLVARANKINGTPMVLTFNPHPLQVLAPNNAPLQIQTFDQKLATLESLGIPVVVAIPFTVQLAQTTARDFVVKLLWEKLRFKEIYVGPNFAFGNRRQGSFNLLKEIGEGIGFLTGKIHQVQFRGNRVSSTAIRQALISGQVGLARRLLARPYALGGTIISGAGIGSKLNVPTANLQTQNDLIPRTGIYVTLFTVEGRRYESVTNIGFRPTINQVEGSIPSIETHVFDFSREIYGERATLEFLLRLRDERKFPSLQALVEQIRKDIARAHRYLHWMNKVVKHTA
jgi:riboflavin kinase/FMN adenylyltransferase